ncbi:hypothetical protein BDW62DRAFT_220903 [Aspergillus aurantiobrunneus]
MSAQAAFYPIDSSLDTSVAPESLLLSNGFSPEFLPLALLEKANHHEDMSMPSMFPPHQIDTVHEVAPNMKFEGDDTGRPRLHNRALRPAPRDSRKASTDMEMNQAQPFFHPYPPVPNGSSFSFSSSSSGDHDPEFGFVDDGVSPHSDLASNKSSSPLRWHNGDIDKRAKHLERNRAAASKSRQKKKRETDQLRNRFQEASRRKSSLETEIKDLHSQLLSLKDQILLHSRCDDEAIHMYLGRMVKQTTKRDSISCISSGGVDHENSHAHEQGAGSLSPPHDSVGLHGHAHSHAHPDMALSPQQVPMRMGGAGPLPCGVEKPMMNQMYTQASDGNIFDLQISIG